MLWCSGNRYCNTGRRRAHLIQLTMPRQENVLIADRGVLLHEMLHQHLTENGESPKHEHAPWCEGIMRLHYDLTGKRVWAAPEMAVKKNNPETGKRKSYRVPRPHPQTGELSIDHLAIATWPHSLGLQLGDFVKRDAADGESDD